MTKHASFITGFNYYPADLMQPYADWISPGVMSAADLVVSAQGPAAMAVNVSGAAQGVPGGSAYLPGGYRFYSDAQIALNIAASDPTNPRIDLVVCGIDTTTTPYTPTIKVITGTPAGSPAVPATPAGYIALAQVLVSAGVTTIVAGKITDVRLIAGLHLNNLGALPPVTAQGTFCVVSSQLYISNGSQWLPVGVSSPLSWFIR